MARISIISDLHLGFERGGEREDDPFELTEEAFRKAKDMNSDLVLLVGDIFDSRLPRPEHWSRFMNLLSVFRNGKSSELEIKEEGHREALKGIPVVAIHGTHERRGETLTNPIEGLEEAGFLIHLHCEEVTFDIDGEKITVHGMSGVPEKYSKEVLKKWDPDPVQGSYNIFMIHQDLEQYIYNPKNPPDLGLEDLPGGFDLYLSGHIHWKERTEVDGSPFLIPGSLVPTQLKKKESERSKGFYFLDTEQNSLEFVEVEGGREFFYEEIEINEESIEEVQGKVKDKLEDVFSKEFDKEPLVRLKVQGELPKGVGSNDIDLSNVKKAYNDRGIVTIKKNLKEVGTEDSIEMLREARDDELSIEEMGMKVLRDEVEETGSGINPGLVFEDLVEGNIDRTIDKLMENTETRKEDEEREQTERKDGKETKEGEWWKQ